MNDHVPSPSSLDPPTPKIAFPFLIVAGLPLLGALGLTLFFMYALESGTLPSAKLKQLHTGMTSAEIEQLIGAPTEISTNRNQSLVWVYKRPFKWRFVKLTLQNDRLLRYIEE